MADKTLLDLTEVTTVLATDLLHISRGTGTDREKKIQFSNLLQDYLTDTEIATEIAAALADYYTKTESNLQNVTDQGASCDNTVTVANLLASLGLLALGENGTNTEFARVSIKADTVNDVVEIGMKAKDGADSITFTCGGSTQVIGANEVLEIEPSTGVITIKQNHKIEGYLETTQTLSDWSLTTGISSAPLQLNFKAGFITMEKGFSTDGAFSTETVLLKTATTDIFGLGTDVIHFMCESTLDSSGHPLLFRLEYNAGYYEIIFSGENVGSLASGKTLFFDGKTFNINPND